MITGSSTKRILIMVEGSEFRSARFLVRVRNLVSLGWRITVVVGLLESQRGEPTRGMPQVVHVLIKTAPASMAQHGWLSRPEVQDGGQRRPSLLDRPRFWFQQRKLAAGQRPQRAYVSELEESLAKAASEFRPDLIYAYGPATLPAAMRLRRRSQSGVESEVVYEATRIPENTAGSDCSTLRRAESMHIGQVRGVVSGSDAEAAGLMARYSLPEPPIVILDSPRRLSESAVSKHAHVREIVGGSVDDPVLVLIQDSGFRFTEHVIAAARSIPTLHLVVLGSKSELRDSAVSSENNAGMDRVHFLKRVPTRNLAAFLDGATGALFTCRSAEGSDSSAPSVRLQAALQAGCPVLVEEGSSMTSLVNGMNAGGVYRPADDPHLRRDLERLVTHSEQYRDSITNSPRTANFCRQGQTAPLVDLIGTVFNEVAPSVKARELRRAFQEGDTSLASEAQQIAAPFIRMANDALLRADLPEKDRQMACAEGMRRASRILFDDQLQNSADTPLPISPSDFLRDWNASSFMERLSEAPPSQEVRSGADSGGSKVLLATNHNSQFLTSITEPLSSLNRDFDTLVLASGMPMPPMKDLMLARLNHDASRIVGASALQARLGGYEVVVVDWCNQGAILISMLAPRSTRVIVRLHSIEALKWHPHLVDWSAVDDLVFVGSPLRSLFSEAVPGASGVRKHVIPIPQEVNPFRLSKSELASCTVGMVGWSSPAKDVQWAMQVLELLRQHDSGFVLRLIGHPPETSNWPGYAPTVLAGIQRLGPAVALVAQTDEVADALTDVGYILSSSIRESFHVGLTEGAASAAVPVVRSWPHVASYGGPRVMFPTDWIVDTPSEAAERIIEISDEGRRATVGHAASQWIEENLSVERISEMWQGLLALPKR